MRLRFRSYLSEESNSVSVNVIGFISGQEPDGLDDEWVGDMEVEGYISGDAVTRMLGVQQRVLQRKLEELDSKKALAFIADGRNPTSKEIIRLAKAGAQKAAALYAGNEFDRGAKVEDVEFGSDSNVWNAKVDPKSGRIGFEIEIGVIGKWR